VASARAAHLPRETDPAVREEWQQCTTEDGLAAIGGSA